MKAQLGTKKRLALVCAAVMLACAMGFWFWGDGASAAEYLTARVERGDLRNTVTATGTLQAVTTVQVGSQASGTISALYADFNSTVKKGQVIAQLDPSTTQAQIEQARANLEQAQAGLQQARAGLVQARAGVSSSRAGVSDAQAKASAAGSTTQNQRAGVTSAEANVAVLKAQLDDAASVLRQEASLLQSGVISQRQYETAETAHKTAQARYNQALAQLNQAVLSERSAASAGQTQAQAQIEQAQSQVEQSQAQVEQSQAQVLNAEAQVQQARAALQLAELNLAHTTIRSPIDGVVVSRNVDVGQTVAASLSAPTLFTIAQDLTQMQVIANIDQADIGLVEQAKSARFDVDAFPGVEFTGTIQQLRLNPVSAQNVVTYNVVIDVQNPEQKLKPGMTANLSITIDERNNVVKIPNAALRFTPQLTEEQRAQRRAAAGSNQSGERGARRQQTENAGGGEAATGQGEARRGGGGVAPSSAPVLAGQVRRVWVLDANKQPQPRRVKIGLTDGAATEIVEGELQEGDVVITGQNVSNGQSATQRQQGSQPSAPGFGGAPRGGGGAGRGR
ncbi:MAG TPA: efflux RND transporter periplasmic adaptor subunit [Pyrinomonadaceae bacterium]|nr:efflux RND transporter periplasmic adaptor subunit [Pyrinomonadaceae bacterium]